MNGDENKGLMFGFVLPALQSVISALWVFILAGLVSYALYRLISFPVGILAVLVGAGVWFAYLRKWHYLTGLSPYQEPEPLPLREVEREPERVSIELLENNATSGQYLSLPARYEQLIALGRGVLSGQGLAIGSWVGTGRPFTRSEFETLRDEMLLRGLLAWHNERARGQGVKLTPQGRAVLKYLASVPPPHGRD